jgi:hypothetical protein
MRRPEDARKGKAGVVIAFTGPLALLTPYMPGMASSSLLHLSTPLYLSKECLQDLCRHAVAMSIDLIETPPVPKLTYVQWCWN